MILVTYYWPPFWRVHDRLCLVLTVNSLCLSKGTLTCQQGHDFIKCNNEWRVIIGTCEGKNFSRTSVGASVEELNPHFLLQKEEKVIIFV